MKGAFLLWLPLLEPLDASVPGFAEQLIGSMLEILKTTFMDYALDELKSSSAVSFLASSLSAPEDREFNKALVAWIKQFTGTSPAHKFGRATSTESRNLMLDIDSLAKKCIFSPNEWYAPHPQTQIMTTNCSFLRTLDILTHILKYHPVLSSKYSVLASIARTQASFALEAADKDIAGNFSKRSKTNKTMRAIQDIEDELSQFEEKLASIDSQVEEWVQGRHRLGEGRNQNREEQNVAVGGQRVEEVESREQFQKWSRYPGVWTPRPIGVL